MGIMYSKKIPCKVKLNNGKNIIFNKERKEAISKFTIPRIVLFYRHLSNLTVYKIKKKTFQTIPT